MSVVLRKVYTRAWSNFLLSRKAIYRSYSDDKSNAPESPEYSSSTILVENGLSVEELPVMVRKLKDLSEIDVKNPTERSSQQPDSLNFHLIQAEFKQCVDLRDVFSLLSKCTKITPNIALGAMERIYDLEKNPTTLLVEMNVNVNMAKGAILDKLLKVVVKTEDTQTILNILKAQSTFMDPYKNKFSDELLFRVIDDKLTIDQLCEFIIFLNNNKGDPKYLQTIDKLWIGFVNREADINEDNIAKIFKILPMLKISKRTINNLLEQKFLYFWSKINVCTMLEILNVFVEEKYSSLESFEIAGRWLYTNIHALNDDSLLDVITKFTRLNYSDDHVEKAVEKYMKLKTSKINSHVLIVGILNYCMHFQIRNQHILNSCSQCFLTKCCDIPSSFLKSFIYPFGYLFFFPKNDEFWSFVENEIDHRFKKITTNDLASLILSFIYVGKYPIKLVNRIFCPDYLGTVKPEVMENLYLIDTALSIECPDYTGPLLPKNQCSKPITQDMRINKIITNIFDCLVDVAGSSENVSTGVLIPNLHCDKTYYIDVMFHPAGLGSKTFNWKLKSAKNENLAILVHLPEHYCSDGQLIGPQAMRKKHLKLLGMRVASLKYSVINQFYISRNEDGLKQYILESIKNAEISF